MYRSTRRIFPRAWEKLWKRKKKKRRKKLGKHSFTVHYTSITQNRGSKIDFVGGNRAWQVVAFDIEGSDRSRVDVTRDSSIVWNLRIMLDILVIKGWERERERAVVSRSFSVPRIFSAFSRKNFPRIFFTILSIYYSNDTSRQITRNVETVNVVSSCFKRGIITWNLLPRSRSKWIENRAKWS